MRKTPVATALGVLLLLGAAVGVAGARAAAPPNVTTGWPSSRVCPTSPPLYVRNRACANAVKRANRPLKFRARAASRGHAGDQAPRRGSGGFERPLKKIDRLSAGTFDREGIVRAVAARAGSRSIPAV
jgi:hypothetical protein